MTADESNQPRRYLRFVLLDPFVRAWRRLGLDDDDQRELEAQIMLAPDAAPVVSGTGGLRKMRFAPRRLGRGKRGALRIGYACFERHDLVLLIAAYAKTDRADLTPREKDRIQALLREIEAFLARRPNRGDT